MVKNLEKHCVKACEPNGEASQFAKMNYRLPVEIRRDESEERKNDTTEEELSIMTSVQNQQWKNILEKVCLTEIGINSSESKQKGSSGPQSLKEVVSQRSLDHLH